MPGREWGKMPMRATVGRRTAIASAVLFAPPARTAPRGERGHPYKGSASWQEMSEGDGRRAGRGPVRAVEFLDYNCGFCRDAHARMGEALRGLGVSLVRRDMPVLGPSSLTAALAVAAARAQDGEGALHEALMGRRGAINDTAIVEAALSAGLDAGRLARDMAGGRAASDLAAAVSVARRAGFRGTPSYVSSDGRALEGFGSPARFRQFLEGS